MDKSVFHLLATAMICVAIQLVFTDMKNFNAAMFFNACALFFVVLAGIRMQIAHNEKYHKDEKEDR